MQNMQKNMKNICIICSSCNPCHQYAKYGPGTCWWGLTWLGTTGVTVTAAPLGRGRRGRIRCLGLVVARDLAWHGAGTDSDLWTPPGAQADDHWVHGPPPARAAGAEFWRNGSKFLAFFALVCPEIDPNVQSLYIVLMILSTTLQSRVAEERGHFDSRGEYSLSMLTRIIDWSHQQEKSVREEKKKRDDSILNEEEQKILRVHLASFVSGMQIHHVMILTLHLLKCNGDSPWQEP